jgi:GNAT superfamily N-acetyltransferase
MTADASTRPEALSSDVVAFAGYVVAAVLIVVVTVLLTQIALRRRNGRPIYRAPDPPDNRPVGTARFDPGPTDPAHPPVPPSYELWELTGDAGHAGAAGHAGDETAAEATASRLRRRAALPVLPAIRAAEAADQPRLAEIEAQSVPGLAGSGLGALPSPALREGAEPSGVLLVAGRPAVAYIRIDEVDGIAHVDQLAVLPSVARRGIGKALLDAAVEWAAGRGYPAMTLSTFAESDWNQRVYDATGFAPVDQLTPGLRELRDWERAIGLDAIGPRVVMRRELSA